jgi:hypothetical protein
MVLQYDRQRQVIGQCQLVNDAHGTVLCCTQHALPQFCNRGLSVTQVAAEWRRRSYATVYTAGVLPFAAIAACIDGGRPFQVGLTFNPSGHASIGHAVLGIGYLPADEDDEDSEDLLYVNDPGSAAPRWISYSALQIAQGQGLQWAHSWNRIR